MPYPTAHPAAVLPLARKMGRRAVLSALVVGSIVPDFWYFVPYLRREDSHSLAGLAWFCLPAGLLLYFAWHLLLKRPLAALAPPAVAARIAPQVLNGLPRRSLFLVVASIAIGIVSHYLWDSLTHDDGLFVEAFPALEARLFAIGGYDLRLFQLLQHASTLLGTLYVVKEAWRGVRAAPPRALPAGFCLPAPARLAILLALAGAALAGALLESFVPGMLPWDPVLLRRALRTLGLAAAEGLGLALLAYCLLFRLYRPNSETRRL